MSSKGYISIYREMQDHWLWKGERFSKGQAWIDILLRANYRDNKVMINGVLTEVKRGSFLTSDKILGDAYGWDKKTVTRFLKNLEKDEMIELSRSPKGTVIFIKNYDKYQLNMGKQEDNLNPVVEPVEEDTEDNPKGNEEDNRKGNTRVNHEDTNNNINNDNKENNIIYMDLSFIDDCITNVKITQEQYNKLKDKFNIELLHDKIIALDVYKDLKKYKDHYKVLNIWCRKEKDNPKYQEKPKADYSYLKPKEPPAWVVDWS